MDGDYIISVGRYGLGSYGEELTSEKLLEQYKVSLGLNAILLFYAVGLGTVLISTVIPIVYVMRLNPKKIMM